MTDTRLQHKRVAVRETDDGGRHFVGFNPQTGKARVSSPIVSFDPALMSGTTRSGRVYTLFGEPDHGAATGLAWGVWCMRNGIDPTTTRTADIAGTASPAAKQ